MSGHIQCQLERHRLQAVGLSQRREPLVLKAHAEETEAPLHPRTPGKPAPRVFFTPREGPGGRQCVAVDTRLEENVEVLRPGEKYRITGDRLNLGPVSEVARGARRTEVVRLKREPIKRSEADQRLPG